MLPHGKVDTAAEHCTESVARVQPLRNQAVIADQSMSEKVYALSAPRNPRTNGRRAFVGELVPVAAVVSFQSKDRSEVVRAADAYALRNPRKLERDWIHKTAVRSRDSPPGIEPLISREEFYLRDWLLLRQCHR